MNFSHSLTLSLALSHSPSLSLSHFHNERRIYNSGTLSAHINRRRYVSTLQESKPYMGHYSFRLGHLIKLVAPPEKLRARLGSEHVYDQIPILKLLTRRPEGSGGV